MKSGKARAQLLGRGRRLHLLLHAATLIGQLDDELCHDNHVMDQGWAGFVESREHLQEIGLLFAGTSDNTATAWQPVITEANGIKVGWLGMTRWLNGNRNPDKDDQPHVNFFPYPGEAAARREPMRPRCWPP
jgi:hypothetical protein